MQNINCATTTVGAGVAAEKQPLHWYTGYTSHKRNGRNRWPDMVSDKAVLINVGDGYLTCVLGMVNCLNKDRFFVMR